MPEGFSGVNPIPGGTVTRDAGNQSYSPGTTVQVPLNDVGPQVWNTHLPVGSQGQDGPPLGAQDPWAMPDLTLPSAPSIAATVPDRVSGVVQAGTTIPLLYGKRRVKLAILLEVWADAFTLVLTGALGAGQLASISRVMSGGNGWQSPTDPGGTAANVAFFLERKLGAVNQTGVSSAYNIADPYGSAVGGFHVGGAQLTFPRVAYVTLVLRDLFNGIGWLRADPNIWHDMEADYSGSLWDPRASGGAGAMVESANSALVIRSFLTDKEYGWGIASSLVDDVSFSAAADVCDQVVNGKKRYETNTVIAAPLSPRQVMDNLLACCAGTLTQSPATGKFGLAIDGARASSGVALVEGSNLQDLQFWQLDTRDAPNVYEIVFPNVDKEWNEDTRRAEARDVITGAKPARPLRLNLDGVTNADQAQRLVNLMMKRSTLANVVFAGLAHPALLACAEGQRFTITSHDGVAAQEVVLEELSQEGQLERFRAREYDPSVYTDDPAAADTPISVTPALKEVTPPEPTAYGYVSVFPTSAKLYVDPPRKVKPAPFTGGTWTKIHDSGTETLFSASQIADGDLDTLGIRLFGNNGSIDVYGAVGLKVDLGSAKTFSRVDLIVDANSTPYYLDTESLFSYVIPPDLRVINSPTIFIASSADAVSYGQPTRRDAYATVRRHASRTDRDVVSVSFTPLADRYWWLILVNGKGQTTNIYDVQYREDDGAAANVFGYEVLRGREAPGDVAFFVSETDRAALGYIEIPSGLITARETFFGGHKFQFQGVELWIRTVYADGTRSQPRIAYHYDSNDAGAIVEGQVLLADPNALSGQKAATGSAGQVLTAQVDGSSAFADAPRPDDAYLWWLSKR